MNTDITLVDVAVMGLSGAALDWAVAKVEGLEPALTPPNYGDGTSLVYIAGNELLYRPSTDWSWGGPLIKKYLVDIVHRHFNTGDGRFVEVHACSRLNAHQRPTYVARDELVAVCLAVVSLSLGDIVKVPACLVMP